MRVTAYFENTDTGVVAVVPDLLWLTIEAPDVFHVRRYIRQALEVEGVSEIELKIDLERGLSHFPGRRSNSRAPDDFPMAKDLNELSLDRRWNFIWNYPYRADLLLGLDPFDPKERFPCQVPSGVKSDYPSAALGSDGRFHLIGGDRCCTQRSKVFQHSSLLTYWAMSSKGWTSRQCPEAGRGWTQEWVDVAWPVKIIGSRVDPSAVPKAERCPNARGVWPAYVNPNSRRAADVVRNHLVEAFGGMCFLCKKRWGQAIDHDHRTGMVRGLLCHDCNIRVDGCLHLTGCPYAEYLNSPPALCLSLPYPGHRTLMRSARYRERIELFVSHGLPAPLGC